MTYFVLHLTVHTGQTGGRTYKETDGRGKIRNARGITINFNCGGGSSPFPSPAIFPFVPFLLASPPFSSPSLSSSLLSLPLKGRPPKIQLESLGERCELPSGVWGGAPAEIEFGAFWLQKLRSGGNNFNYFSENKLTKLAILCSLYICLCFVWRIGPPGLSWLRHCVMRPIRTWVLHNNSQSLVTDGT